MTCAEVMERLDDYVDGELDEAGFQAVELHLSGCAECRDEERMVRGVLARAAALPLMMTPPRDLWPAVAARIEGRGRVLPFLPRWMTRKPWNPVLLAAVAAAVVAVASAIGVSRIGEVAAPATAPRVAASVPAGRGIAVPASLGADGLEEAEAEYTRAAAALLSALEARRASLPPETLRAIERNLRTIDVALDDVRGALRKDPGNRQLAYLLASTHQRKVDVLRRVVRLTTQL